MRSKNEIEQKERVITDFMRKIVDQLNNSELVSDDFTQNEMVNIGQNFTIVITSPKNPGPSHKQIMLAIEKQELYTDKNNSKLKIKYCLKRYDDTRNVTNV